MTPLECTWLDTRQKTGLMKAYDGDSTNGYIFWWKMGTGKTRLGLATFEFSGYEDLILVCRRISFWDWINEMEKCGLDYNVYLNDYTPANLVRLARTKKPKRVLLVSTGDLKSVPEHYPKGQFLLVDELYLFANPLAKRSIALQRISLFCSARVGLSGTIQPAQDSIAIFGQLMALQIHRDLAKTSTAFRTRFQVRTKGKFGRSWIAKPGSAKTIRDLIANRVDTYMPEGRPTVRQILVCDKTPEQAKAVKQLKEEYTFEGRDYKYALQVLNAVNGISNGWYEVGHWEGEGKNRSWVVDEMKMVRCGKIARLFALIEELMEEKHKFVIWCAYHNDIDLIEAVIKLLKKPLRYALYTGEDEFDLEGWQNDQYDFTLATESMGGAVNWFGQVKYAIYYSINFKLLDLQQTMGRHERKDSKHDGAHFYFLQTKGTYDARAYQLVNDSAVSEQELIAELQKEKI